MSNRGCDICQAPVQNPFNANHINSRRHQDALQGGGGGYEQEEPYDDSYMTPYGRPTPRPIPRRPPPPRGGYQVQQDYNWGRSQAPEPDYDSESGDEEY